ncbi:hypothetical protein DPMN_038841 [Dreissena polymorpha]|uniref:Ig-like domain-containing protein n=1 Tax=Dreissena polymorpha TaxID=45954 RepID=A0A9D4MDH9_DREPO|nr:hypothetical protein DPMN_038841 [Dreissena polymorpha]
MTGKRNVTFVCSGFGDPPPRMNLASESLKVSTNNSYLRLDISLTTSQDSGTFICIAANVVTIQHEYVDETSIQLACTVDTDAPKSVGFYEYLFGKPTKLSEIVRIKLPDLPEDNTSKRRSSSLYSLEQVYCY